MASSILAFVTETPTPDTYDLYMNFVGDKDVLDDEGAFPCDVDWYLEEGFDSRDLIVKRSKSSMKGILARFIRYETVSITTEVAYDNAFVPDVAVAPDGIVLSMFDYQHGDRDYMDLLEDYPGCYVTYCLWHS